MQIVKVNVRGNREIFINCPTCGRFKKMFADTYRYGKHYLKVRCSCKTFFKLQLDYRQYYRKSVSLSGRYKTLFQYHKKKGAIHITDISLGGLRCDVVGLNRLDPGYILALDFFLDNKQGTQLNERALVRFSEGHVIGCEFIGQNRNKDLIAYFVV